MDTYNTDNPATEGVDDSPLSEQELNTVAGGVIQPWPVPKPDPGPTPFGGLAPWPVPNPTDPPWYGGDPRDPDPNYKAPPTNS